GGGAAHSLANPLSDRAEIAHGLANAIVLPAVMEFNLPVTMGRLALIAEAMGVETRQMNEEEAARAGIVAVRRFFEALDIPMSLSAANIDANLIPRLAAEAARDDLHLTNPRPCTESDFRAMYEASFDPTHDE
ncbi:MAG: iron-containing alcohol dehydrogenase, partial [Candidatus Poribacteria bacterium]|nr:iron-containing alcohol dehydrogenase [Candidatus Poribacteria bacterium]